jgi:hypothetical protein
MVHHETAMNGSYIVQAGRLKVFLRFLYGADDAQFD